MAEEPGARRRAAAGGGPGGEYAAELAAGGDRAAVAAFLPPADLPALLELVSAWADTLLDGLQPRHR